MLTVMEQGKSVLCTAETSISYFAQEVREHPGESI